MLTCKHLSLFPNLTHAFTTRHGGISLAPYDTLNLAFHVGDDPLHVNANHDLLAAQLGYEKAALVHMRQIHSDIVHIISDDDDFDHPRECDALITDRIGVALMIMSADCIPLIIYDPLRHVVAVVHAGRAGAFKNIVARTVATMQCHFTCKSESLHVTLGPSIHGCCYEVGEAIAREAEALGYGAMVTCKDKRYFLHVNAIVKAQLEALGVAHVEEIGGCTACNSRDFFSYRAEGGVTGRIAGVALLR